MGQWFGGPGDGKPENSSWEVGKMATQGKCAETFGKEKESHL